MKIYTRTGDDGTTGLFAGPRVAKDAPRIEAYGTVDELNCVLGLARTSSLPAEIDALLARIQSELFNVGAELATPEPSRLGGTRLTDDDVLRLETEIDRWEAPLPPLRQFILPGGTRAAAELHLGRTVCRRAERCLVRLVLEEGVQRRLLIYLNRLSDLLFVLARNCNLAAGMADVPWSAGEPTGG